MENIKTIILFIYMLVIFMGVAGLTITVLADHKKKTELNKTIKLFVIGLVATNVYDFILYYKDYEILGLPSAFAIRLGCGIIALLACLWVNMAYRITDDKPHAFIRTSIVVFSLAYGIFWVLLAILFPTVSFHVLRWFLLATDIIFILMVALAGVVFMNKAISEGKRGTLTFLMLVTALIIWNYIAFVIGETLNNLDITEQAHLPLDMTILFWFIVNAATILFIFRTAFTDAYGSLVVEATEAEALVDAGQMDVFESLKQEYGLTDREKELCHMIYDGKSNVDISKALFITESTVKTHVYNLYRKTGVKSRMEIIRIVREHSV